MRGEILAPAAVLLLWTLAMLVWLAAVRIPPLRAMNARTTLRVGGRGQDLENVLPPKANWKSHNYTHLTEQPTLFYAAVIILALTAAGRIDVWLAWAYVVLRIVHSLWQSLVNRVPERFALFMASTLCLLVLAIRAALACFAAGV